jgi:hypothetical protein
MLGGLGSLFFLFLLVKAAIGPPNDLLGEAFQQKAEIDLIIEKGADIDPAMKDDTERDLKMKAEAEGDLKTNAEAEGDLKMKEEAELDKIIMEEAGIGTLNIENAVIGSSDALKNLSMSADVAVVIKDLDTEVGSTKSRNSEDDELKVKARSSGINLEAREDRSGEVRQKGGNNTSPEPCLNEEGRSNESGMFGWMSQIIDAWKSFRNGIFTIKLEYIFHFSFLTSLSSSY